MKECDKNVIKERNWNYFQAFTHTRGSVSMLKIALAGIAISLLDFMPFYADAVSYGTNLWKSKLNILLFSVAIFMVFCFVLSFWTSFIYKYQSFVSILLVCFTVALTFSMVFMGLILVENTDGMRWKWENVNNKVFIFVMSGLYIVLLIYNIIWIKRQLLNGFSEERTNKNYLASNVYESKSLVIIYVCTMAGAAVTGIWEKLLGYGAAVLFICAYSRLHIEMGYAAYLRIKDKQYWEEMPEKKVWTREEKRAARVKWLKIINVFFCFGILCFLCKLVEKYELARWQIYIARAVIILIFLDLGTVVILWIIKKYVKYGRRKRNEDNE